MSNYTKGQQILAEKKLQNELAKPDRIKKEAEFAERYREESDEVLIDHIASLKMKRGKRFDRYTFIGYQHAMERFGTWSKMIYLVNQRIEEIRQENTDS
ncbi:MAG: hypothetical protein IKV45_01750 [Firmicutes bacterium]|nr:hypothetical protein [Bacillota bacterium]